MPYTVIDGIRLERRIIPGDASKPWLVLLHEGLGSVSLWRDFPDKLARRLDMPALIYSRRGYGQSDGLGGPRQPDYLHHEALDVLPKLLDSLAIRRTVLVGHSDGASIALISATHHPERVAATVLMAPHVFVEPVSRDGIARTMATYEGSDLKIRLGRHHAHVDDAFYGWARIWLDPRFRTWSLAPECGRLSVPTLLIQGENDEYGTLAHIDAIEAAAPIPPQRLVLAGCGHAPHRQCEREVLDAITAFANQFVAPA
jgi:pimeloyl-ACP methyl ester carboxylesterase